MIIIVVYCIYIFPQSSLLYFGQIEHVFTFLKETFEYVYTLKINRYNSSV